MSVYIKVTVDQLKELRDKSFDCAADVAKKNGHYLTEDQIRVMKNEPVNVEWK